MTDETPKKRGNPNIPPGPGRPKGVPNKINGLLKDAIVKAAELAGGEPNEETKYPGGLVGFLYVQALKAENGPFMTLLGKVLPMQLTGANGDPLIDVKSAMADYLGSLTNEQLALFEAASAALATAVNSDGDDPEGEG